MQLIRYLPLLSGLLLTPQLQAAQHALVVGINDYAHHTDLKGAVNDAKLIAQALRNAGVKLPDNRVLLDGQATRANLVTAWHDMVKQAKPGDTLIFTYAGHGGQETDLAPLDEKDDLDETLMLHDFNESIPKQGRISDDELQGLFKDAADYRILFVADSCHSGGMVRALTPGVIQGLSRSGGLFNIKAEAPPPHPVIKPTGDETEDLEHVTLITAVDKDTLKVYETEFGGKEHGALSWYFAEALQGKADGNGNGQLERGELERFLRQRVTDHMANLQNPRLQPRGDDNLPVIELNGVSAQAAMPPMPRLDLPVRISAGNVVLPAGLNGVKQTNVGERFDLMLRKEEGAIQVYNHLGDRLSAMPMISGKPDWQRLIDKHRLLKALADQSDMRLQQVAIELGASGVKRGERVTRGTVVEFTVTPEQGGGDLKALTLFNLSGNGELQMLFPLYTSDPKIIDRFPYTYPRVAVVPPFGGEELVAVLCDKPPTALHHLLSASQDHPPSAEQFVSALKNQRCQIARHAFFTADASGE